MGKEIEINVDSKYMNQKKYPNIRGVATLTMLHITPSTTESVILTSINTIFNHLTSGRVLYNIFQRNPVSLKTLNIGNQYLISQSKQNCGFDLVLNTELFDSIKLLNTPQRKEFFIDIKNDVLQQLGFKPITPTQIFNYISRQIITHKEIIPFTKQNFVIGISEQPFLANLINNDYQNIFQPSISKSIKKIEDHSLISNQELHQLQIFLSQPKNINTLIANIENSKYITQLRQQEFLSTRISIDEANNYLKNKNPVHKEIVESKEYIKFLNNLPEKDLENFFNTFNYKLKIPQSSMSGDIVSKPKFR